MKDKSTPRIRLPQTTDQLKKELSFIFPGVTISTLPLTTENTNSIPKEIHGYSNLFWDSNKNIIYTFIKSMTSGQPETLIKICCIQNPKVFDLRLTNAYLRIFQEDCHSAPEKGRHGELWEILTSSRVRRVITRVIQFNTKSFLKWLTTMESAANLRYEGQAFQIVAIMSKQAEWVAKRAHGGYIPLKNHLPFEKALLNEKWIRAISNSSEVALHGVSHSGDIQGILDLSTSIDNSIGKISLEKTENVESNEEFTLPTKLKNVTRFVINGTMAFICAPNGDLYIILPNGISFMKTQGSWHYLNFSSFHDFFSEKFSEKIAPQILNLLLDLSFERKGALICVIDDEKMINSIVPDYGNETIPNFALRQAISGTKIHDENFQHVIKAAASVDGAIVIKNNGIIVDAACMIGEPSQQVLQAAGFNRLERLAGARSTAAWNGSMFGTSIKVSEDGPITVFVKGKLVAQLG